jgi:hypothetical protein
MRRQMRSAVWRRFGAVRRPYGDPAEGPRHPRDSMDGDSGLLYPVPTSSRFNARGDSGISVDVPMAGEP